MKAPRCPLPVEIVHCWYSFEDASRRSAKSACRPAGSLHKERVTHKSRAATTPHDMTLLYKSSSLDHRWQQQHPPPGELGSPKAFFSSSFKVTSTEANSNRIPISHLRTISVSRRWSTPAASPAASSACIRRVVIALREDGHSIVISMRVGWKRRRQGCQCRHSPLRDTRRGIHLSPCHRGHLDPYCYSHPCRECWSFSVSLL